MSLAIAVLSTWCSKVISAGQTIFTHVDSFGSQKHCSLTDRGCHLSLLGEQRELNEVFRTKKRVAKNFFNIISQFGSLPLKFSEHVPVVKV